jgi:tRNA nucleotidyltransferase (CCA-adding enzyme)
VNLIDRLPKEVQGLLRQIGELGNRVEVQTYAVGGFVRDLILGVSNLDLDVTVEGDGRYFAESLAREIGGEVLSYDRFGTATLILHKNGPIGRMDIATARRERYPYPGALPEVEPGTIAEDLFRRDFTINAMAMALNPDRFGELVDLYGGLKDLKEGLIRVMHDRSFIDDPTRLFRAVRFETRYDFRLEPHTASLVERAIRDDMPLKVSRGRIWHELRLILAEEVPEKPIGRLCEIGLLTFVNPDLDASEDTMRFFGRIRDALAELRRIGVRDRVDLSLVYFAAMIRGFREDQIHEICREFGLSKEEERKLLDSLQIQHLRFDSDRRSRIYRAFEGRCIESLLFLLAKTDDERVKSFTVEYLIDLRYVKPLISGEDLKALGLKPGPIFGKILRDAFDGQLDRELTSRSDLRGFLIRRGYIKCQ